MPLFSLLIRGRKLYSSLLLDIPYHVGSIQTVTKNILYSILLKWWKSKVVWLYRIGVIFITQIYPQKDQKLIHEHHNLAPHIKTPHSKRQNFKIIASAVHEVASSLLTLLKSLLNILHNFQTKFCLRVQSVQIVADIVTREDMIQRRVSGAIIILKWCPDAANFLCMYAP